MAPQDTRQTDAASTVQPLVLNLIGYWATGHQGKDRSPGWPNPADLAGAWEPDDRRSVIDDLGQGVVCRRFYGWARCRLCSERLGAAELTDGVWAWPEKLEHYIKDHSIRLPDRFVELAKAAGWQISPSLCDELRREIREPQLFMDSGGRQTPVDRPGGRPIVLDTRIWLDWSAANSG